MNYYQHHIGDFNNDTRHLTRIERSVYRDMIELYYDTEKPLSLDIATLGRKLLARSDEEKAAVINMLSEFFFEDEDGYHNPQCDIELARVKDLMEEAEGKRENERERQRRARDRRKELFAQLREYDDVPPWNTSVEDLQSRLNTHLSRVTGRDNTSTSQVYTDVNTANQYPIPSTQYPVPIDQEPPKVKTLAAADAAAPKKKAAAKEEPNPLNLETWQSYRQAYRDRYSVNPVRDVATNAKIKAIVAGLGSDAPMVAEFFVWHNDARYVRGMHQVGMMSMDYAKLRTEWMTNTRMTYSKAQQADKTATNLDSFAPLIAAAKAREQAEREAECQAAK